MGQGRVLVVDDEEGVRSLLESALELSGYRVDTASNAEEALCLWGNNLYDLVITDIVLPRSRGMDLVRTLRARDDHVPILAITGYGQEVAQEALDAGADHVLGKPFHLMDIRQLVDQMMR